LKVVRFHSEARLELIDQIAYYEEVQAGLGQRFLQEIESAIALIAARPTVGLIHKHGTQRVFPRKFPFSIVYTAGESGLVIVAIASFRRRPGYWQGRQHGI